MKELRLGDVVSIPLFGVFRHYGVVVEEGNFLKEATIRTVARTKSHPINQTLTEFSQGKNVNVLKYPSTLPRCQVVQNAINVSCFDYNVVNNNCEHFFRRAHGINAYSTQVITTSLVLISVVGVMLITKQAPKRA